MKAINIALLLLLLAAPAALAAGNAPPPPGEGDKCAVCGMFVHKYADWVVTVGFSDGSYAYFDGPKDMFKFIFNLGKYAPNRRADDIMDMHVTDYYDLTPISATDAYYVIGSDIHGPMGRELVPFKDEEAAGEFRRDHKGQGVLKFRDVTPELVEGLDR